MGTQNLHVVGGTVGTSPGLVFTAGGGATGTINIDYDGVMEGNNLTGITVDLSEALGYRLGKQIPMTANFRINYLRFGIRNVNDGNDNNGHNYFAGDWEWYTPTKHRVDAVQAWRGLEKRMEEDEVDHGLMSGTPDDEYKGFRYGWFTNAEVSHATGGAPAELPNGYALTAMLNVYNSAMENDGQPTRGRNLWDRKVGRSSHLGTHAQCVNGEFDGAFDSIYTANIQDGEWHAPDGHAIEVLGGLLRLNITHSSTNSLLAQAIADDFQVYIDVGVSGWSSW